MDEEQGIYRGEVLVIMGALADIETNVRRVLHLIEGEEPDEEAEDLPDA